MIIFTRQPSIRTSASTLVIVGALSAVKYSLVPMCITNGGDRFQMTHAAILSFSSQKGITSLTSVARLVDGTSVLAVFVCNEVREPLQGQKTRILRDKHR